MRSSTSTAHQLAPNTRGGRRQCGVRRLPILRAALVAALVVFAVAWWAWPLVPEGPVLLAVTRSHGLVLRDLPALAALASAAALSWWRRPGA
jgi:hypothetical protein